MMGQLRCLPAACALVMLAACDGGSGAAAEPECTPAKVPECVNEGDPISCDVAVWTWFGGDARGEKSPRAICEAACPGGEGDGLAAGGCVDGLDFGYCMWLNVPCDACCTLTDGPPEDVLHDHDPCTQDLCDARHCIHPPLDWVGQPCRIPNDFGTCRGNYLCQQECQTDAPCWGAQQVCDTTVPGPEEPNGIDDDCDGQTDETEVDPLYRFSGDGSLGYPEVVALDDRRFVAGWLRFPGQGRGRLRLRAGTVEAPLSGTEVGIEDSGAGDIPSHVFAVPGGVFGVSGADEDGRTLRYLVLQEPGGAPLRAGNVSLEERHVLDSFPVVAAAHDKNRVVLAWRQVTAPDRDTPDLRMQRFNADGPVEGVIDVASARYVGPPALLALPEGRWMVAWVDAGNTYGAPDVLARRYEADGSPRGDVFALNDTPAIGDAYRPAADSQMALALAPDGRVVAAWSGAPPDTYDRVARMRVLQADGPPAGPEVTVSNFLGQDIRVQGVAANAARGLVVWSNWGSTPAGPGQLRMASMRLSVAGYADQVELATPPIGSPIGGALALMPDGTRVVAWVHTQGAETEYPALDGVRLRVLPP